MFRTAALAVCLLAGTAAADGPAQAVATYAIVVGSNGGGPGQVTLRYAEDDARRVGDVLAELGGYTRDHVDVVLHPTPDQLRDRLTKLATQVKGDVAAGRQAQIFFYYSGHARASAIDLGNDELPLEELRARLFDVPATLTVVVLDACPGSGAFSRIKGAAPAADFSFNSRQHLDATGVAVLASSSGSELSQESEQLHSSYFTHHLLVGLRGAGDANGDGQVSIDEAYRYAYNQTLLATAETAVGGQHVTFEADLKGHGEVPLSFPRAATASIELPARLEGKTLVEDKRAHAVVAETYKARGAAVRIAVAPGDYEVLVRQGETLSRCEVTAPGTIDLDRCRSEALVKNPTKGGGFEHPTIIEVGGMLGVEREDDYTNRLKTFGYQEDLIPLTSTLEIAALRQVAPRLWVGGIASAASLPQWTHDIAGSNTGLTFNWQLYTIGPVVRGEQHLTDIRLLGHQVARFDVYAQLAAGLAIGRTELVDAMNKTTTTTDAGPAFDAGAGTHFADLFGSGLGLSIGGSYGYAPAFTDLIGDTHASGGFRLDAALSFRR